MDTVLSIDWTLLVLQFVQVGVFCVGVWLLLLRPVVRQVERRRALAIRTEAERDRARAALTDVQAKRVEILNRARKEAEAIRAGESVDAQKDGGESTREAVLLLEEHFTQTKLERS